MPVPPPLSTAHHPQPEMPSSVAPPVFVDLDGRRARLMRAIGAGLALLCGAYLLLVTLSLLGVPIAPLPVPLPGEPRPTHHHRAVRVPEPSPPPTTLTRAEDAPSADIGSAAGPTLMALAREVVDLRAMAASASATSAQPTGTRAPASARTTSTRDISTRSAIGHVVLPSRGTAASRPAVTALGATGNGTTGSGSASGPATGSGPVRATQPTEPVRRPAPAAKAVPPGLVRAAAVRSQRAAGQPSGHAAQHAPQHVTQPPKAQPARPTAASVRAQGGSATGRARATRGR